jgi:outer membrane lipoprotein
MKVFVMEDEMEKWLKGSRAFYVITMGAILSLLFMLGGCSTTQERPNQQESYEKIPFSEILRSPERYRGKVVRLGGVILDVGNKEEGGILEILEQPLSWRGRPKPGDQSGGRFMVVLEEFLDEEIYRSKRPITVVGEIVGTKEAPMGEATYCYPLLSGREIRLWEEGAYWDRPRIHFGIGASGGSGGTSVGGGVGISF